jgi:hypothetical protein
MQAKFKSAAVIAAVALLGTLGTAHASIGTFTGSDNGASTSGPWVNSAAAESTFDAAASGYGALQTLTFESQSLGLGGFTEGNASVSFSAPDYGNGFSGISNATSGNLYGFNVTAGGSQWLGAPLGSATFTFAGGTNSFGGYFTGLQTTFSGTALMVVTFNDGSSQTLNVPVNADGGATYFGFTDTTAFSSVTIANSSNDAWGVDNVTFTTAVPEPASVVLMMAGLAVVGGACRRTARKQA